MVTLTNLRLSCLMEKGSWLAAASMRIVSIARLSWREFGPIWKIIGLDSSSFWAAFALLGLVFESWPVVLFIDELRLTFWNALLETGLAVDNLHISRIVPTLSRLSWAGSRLWNAFGLIWTLPVKRMGLLLSDFKDFIWEIWLTWCVLWGVVG